VNQYRLSDSAAALVYKPLEESLRVQVVAKSTKLLPTMVMGTILLGRRFKVSHYCAAACLCVGLAGFAYIDGQDAEKHATMIVGILLLG
jgi:hypothetical protein